MRAVDNPEVADEFPATASALGRWEQGTDVPLTAFPALIQDLGHSHPDLIGAGASRLNRERSGFHSLLRKTSSALPLAQGTSPLSASDIRGRLVEIDARWGDSASWRAITRNGSRHTSAYLLAALDHRVDDAGRVVPVENGVSNYQGIFARTFLISAIVTLATLRCCSAIRWRTGSRACRPAKRI